MSDRRQRQKEHRAAKREAERKSESRRELLKRLGTALLFGVAVIAVIMLSGLLRNGEPSLPAGYEDFRAQETACGADQPPAEGVMSFGAPETVEGLADASSATVTLVTSCGDITIELELEDSPETTNSFVFLANQGFYDGQVIHRISEDYVFQGGDPHADGTGGPGYVIADEFPAEGFVYEEGVVAMANRGARSTGSQFFVVTGANGRFLTNQFNVLGRVVSGQDVMDAIMAVPTATAPGTVEKSLPLESVYIEAISVDISDS